MAEILRRDDVMKALGTVNDPDLKKDLVTLGMVKDVRISADFIGVQVELTTPACPLKEIMTRDIKLALGKLEGCPEVTVDFTANVSGRNMTQGDLVPGIRNIIGVASGKGGVGKSTTALNLAVALSSMGASVGILDADIYGPNIPTMMGTHAAPGVVDKKMVPLESFGLKMISMGLLVPPNKPVVWRGPMLNSALRQFFADVHWGALDYLIVDLPPGTGDVQISLVQLVQVTGCIIVTTPQAVSLEDARRGLEMFHQTNTPVLGIVENMSWFTCPNCDEKHFLFGGGGGERIATELELPFLGGIPFGKNVREGGDNGIPVMISDPESEQGARFMEIAGALAQQVSLHNLEEASNTPLEINI
jgi:ATP-binding protein involved in chromosome partitioning